MCYITIWFTCASPFAGYVSPQIVGPGRKKIVVGFKPKTVSCFSMTWYIMYHRGTLCFIRISMGKEMPLKQTVEKCRQNLEVECPFIWCQKHS